VQQMCSIPDAVTYNYGEERDDMHNYIFVESSTAELRTHHDSNLEHHNNIK
jgi:hypothetical protein